MAHLIDKDALVSEIERRNEESWLGHYTKEKGIVFDITDDILSFIDTLEVKEVDLEKHLKEDIEDVLFDLDGVAVKGATHYLTVEDVKDIAKHFYELGMQVSNKTQKEE